MFLLVPAHPGFPGQIPQSRKTVVCVCTCSLLTCLLPVIALIVVVPVIIVSTCVVVDR